MQRRIVKSIRRKENASKYVYNLSIKDNHNYFANNILVHNCDDPNNTRFVESKIIREGVLEWWTKAWSTRLNDKKNDCRIVIQQRSHESDLSGYILSNDTANEWERLILPMEFETSRRCITSIGADWRKVEGELLWPDVIGENELISLKNDLGSSYAVAGQLQQRPSPAEGGIIKKTWFKKWVYPSLPTLEVVIQSWDTAISDKPDAAYSACTTWGVFYDNSDLFNVIMLSQWRGRVGYPELRERAKRLYYNYLDTGEHKSLKLAPYKVDICLIEAKATGDPLIRDLRLAGIAASGYIPKGDKDSRVQRIAPLLESGLVWLPTEPQNREKLLPWADEFLEEVASFPNAESKDLTDTLSQMLSYLQNNSTLIHPKDPREEISYKEPVRPYGV